MAGMYEPVTFTTTTVPVHDGEARLPKRYPHQFASVPDHWETVRTRSKYVSFPLLPPDAAGHMMFERGYIEDDVLDLPGRRMVYAGPYRRPPRWRRVLDESRYRISHALAALRGDTECDYPDA